jgi:hypothetical protein
MTACDQIRLDDEAEGFTTPTEKRRRASATRRLKAAQIDAARRLDAACDAMRELIGAFEEVHPGLIRPEVDGRNRLIADMAEYSTYLVDRTERGIV